MCGVPRQEDARATYRRNEFRRTFFHLRHHSNDLKPTRAALKLTPENPLGNFKILFLVKALDRLATCRREPHCLTEEAHQACVDDNDKFRVNGYCINTVYGLKKNEEWWMDVLQVKDLRVEDCPIGLGSIKV